MSDAASPGDRLRDAVDDLTPSEVHRVLADFPRDLRGRLLLAAWEAGTGATDLPRLVRLGAALLWKPDDAMDAFHSGRRATSFFDRNLEAVADEPVDAFRARWGADEDLSPSTDDAMALVRLGAVGIILVTAPVVLGSIGMLFLWSSF